MKHPAFTNLPARALTLLRRTGPYLALILIVSAWLLARFTGEAPSAYAIGHAIAGRVMDEQGRPILDAEVVLFVNNDRSEPIAEDSTQRDGSFLLFLPPDETIRSAHLEITRHHFHSFTWDAAGDELRLLRKQGALILDDITLSHSYSPGFWIAAVIFIGMLVLIAIERFHSTLTALLATAAIFLISFVGGHFTEALYIIDFEHALDHIDFEVIFLLMGMMIVIGIIEETGIFQWLAYYAYRLSRGKVWLLCIILMLIASVVSAMLDNVTTMLLITPMTIEIALALGTNPLALLIPALMAANVGGTATLIGTPTNILVGSYAGLGFNDFLINLTPGVLMMEAALIVFALLWYRRQHRRAGAGVSPALLKRLEENSKIKDPLRLRKALIVLALLLLLFIIGERFHLTPAVSAIIGAVAMLIWVNPDIEQMMGVVDWTTLVFFMGLFIVVGAVDEVGLIGTVADAIAAVVGNSLPAAMMVLTWASTLLSGVVANIPFTAAMLPAVDYLTRAVPSAVGPDLFFALALGAAAGGNLTLIAASPNLVVAGITERAGYPLTFIEFLKVGVPATLITTAMGALWLVIRFL
ncbi:MAG: ArsB/NhaD family transporter [Anaerolineae bacterium]